MPLPDPTPFDALEDAFCLLSRAPSARPFVGSEIHHGLPDRPMTFTELRSVLLHPSTPYETRDGALRGLVERARTDGGEWTVVLAGVLLPGLGKALAPLAEVCPERAVDLQAETLAGLIEALPRFETARGRCAARLVWRATDRARRLLARELAATGRRDSSPLGAEPHRPWDHPDFILRDAVRAGKISRADAELIGETRLGGVPLHRYADGMGVPYLTVRLRRFRAEQKLLAWLPERDDVVAGFFDESL